MNWRPIVLVILVVGVGAAVYYSLQKGPSLPEGYQFEERPESVDGSGAGAASGQAPAAQVEQVEKDLEQEKAFVYSAAGLRNPMTPFVAKPKPGPRQAVTPRPGAARPAGGHKLDGIMWSPTNPLAIIDGSVMGVGESLKDGSSVAEIGKSYVVLKRGTRKTRLALQ